MIRDWIFKENRLFWSTTVGFFLVILTLTVLSLFYIDQSWAQYFASPDRVDLWQFHRSITEVGAAEPYIAIALIGLFFAKFRKRAAFFAASLATCGLVIHLFKFLIGRSRPHKLPDHDPFVFDFFNFHHHFQSLPSGHSQTLFTTATFFSFLFPKASPYLFVFAFYFAMTRALTIAHFVSDVILGAGLGIIVTVITTRHLVQKYGS